SRPPVATVRPWRRCLPCARSFRTKPLVCALTVALYGKFFARTDTDGSLSFGAARSRPLGQRQRYAAPFRARSELQIAVQVWQLLDLGGHPRGLDRRVLRTRYGGTDLTGPSRA